MKIILAITEDKYGCSAIAELIRKLEENKKIENEIKLDCHSMGGKGNIISVKTVRIVKVPFLKDTTKS
jgi:esterase/lipase superfamily enzyme